MEPSVVFACLSPHPPVIIPDIGGFRIDQVAGTLNSLRKIMQRLVAGGPDGAVIISPHAPRDRRGFTAYTGHRIKGDFAQFGSPNIEIDLPNDVVLLSRLDAICREAKIPLQMLPAGRSLDHGALVPLFFLREAGWDFPVVVLGLPFDANVNHVQFGKCIAQVANQLNRRIALVASGDMSHRLTPDAPYPYHPRAREYDETLVAALTSGDVSHLLEIDEDLRELAGEDTYQSLLVALGSLGGQFRNPRVYSYEGPFGVGYLTAVLGDFTPHEISCDEPAANSEGEDNEPQAFMEALDLARRSVETYLKENRIPTPEIVHARLADRAGVFVCLKTRHGELRGCVGTTGPSRASIAEEIVHNAVAAATEDPRFPPVQLDELPELVYSIDILSPLEQVESLAELDPDTYGLMVETEDGRRGLLLPHLAGIVEPEQQIALAKKKGRISLETPVNYYRFKVERLCEAHTE